MNRAAIAYVPNAWIEDRKGIGLAMIIAIIASSEIFEGPDTGLLGLRRVHSLETQVDSPARWSDARRVQHDFAVKGC